MTQCRQAHKQYYITHTHSVNKTIQTFLVRFVMAFFLFRKSSICFSVYWINSIFILIRIYFTINCNKQCKCAQTFLATLYLLWNLSLVLLITCRADWNNAILSSTACTMKMTIVNTMDLAETEVKLHIYNLFSKSLIAESE